MGGTSACAATTKIYGTLDSETEYYTVSIEDSGTYDYVYGNPKSGSSYDSSYSSNNVVSITNNDADSTTTIKNLYGGYTTAESTEASYNTVNVSGAADDEGTNNISISSYVAGGYSTSSGGSIYNVVTLNNVTMTGSTAYVIGGQSATGDANNNTVYLTDSIVTKYVYGGRVTGVTGTANNNTVVLSGTTTSSTSGVIYGGSSKTDASGNTVSIENGSSVYTVYGGYSATKGTLGTVQLNTVTIDASYAYSNVIGGYSYDGVSAGNSVVITNGSEVTNTIYGNRVAGTSSNSGTATGVVTITEDDGTTTEETVTAVYISESTVTDVYGGYAGYYGEVSYNAVVIENSSVGKVMGGYTVGGDAIGNSVSLSNSSASDSLYGAYAGSNGGSAYNNSVLITEGSIVDSAVYGGYSKVGVAGNNSVSIYDSEITSSVYGGYTPGTDSDDTSSEEIGTEGNTVYIENSSVGGYVVANRSGTGDAEGNGIVIDDDGNETYDVTIINSTITNSVRGGDAASSATNNSVYVEGSVLASSVIGGASSSADSEDTVTGNSVVLLNTTVESNVYGGYGFSSSAVTISGNSVTLLGGVEVGGSVYGGYSSSESVTISDNSLTVSGTGNSALKIGNFSSITFDVTDRQAGDTMLSLTLEGDTTEDADSGEETTVNAVIDLGEAEITVSNYSEVELEAGEKITLIATSGTAVLTNYTLADIEKSVDYELDSDSNDSVIKGTFSILLTEELDDDDNSVAIVLKGDDTIYVSTVSLDTEYLEWGNTLIALDGDLSYDFSGASLTISDTTVINTGEFLDVGSSTTLIDGEDSTVTDLSAIADVVNSYSYSLLDGTVTVSGTGITEVSGNSLVYSVSNISALDFDISAETDISKPILSVESADLTGTAVTVTAHVDGNTDLGDGYSVTLVKASGEITTDGASYSGTLIEGVSIEYDLDFEVDDQMIIASYVEEEPETPGNGTMRKETKSIVETRLAEVALLEQGQDQINYVIGSANSITAGKDTYMPFVTMGASSLSYDTGSSIDIDGFNAAVAY